MVNQSFWENKKVLVTGNTGFKGSWISLWLHKLGAKVYGLALKPDTNPSLFDQLGLNDLIKCNFIDIRRGAEVQKVVEDLAPDIIIHMAAQPIVLRSYKEPVYTWETNVLGTINLLEATRKLQNKCAVLVITTDKVYKNNEWHFSYREVDRLGGRDPYSSSKAATELVVSSWRESFLNDMINIRVASARAGNVIGGGDWAENRLVPDIVRSIESNEVVNVRSPLSVRPWQHVLDPLSGYLMLCELLYQSDDKVYQSAFNFGPMPGNNQTVGNLVDYSLSIWKGSWKDVSSSKVAHEAGLLKVNIDKSYSILKWKPQWDFYTSVEKTINWYKKRALGHNPRTLVLEDIKNYSQL